MAFMDKLFGGPAEPKFWKWFEENSSRLAEVKTCREPVCADLSAQMKRVNKGLVFSFGPVVDGRREFVVSAGGIRDVFPAVRKLVDAAPDIPNWKITAFRPPTDMGEITINNYTLKAEDVWFKAAADGERLGLILYADGLSMENETTGHAMFILLDHTIGEYDVETKIGSLDFQDLPADPASLGLRPITDLKAVVKEFLL